MDFKCVFFVYNTRIAFEKNIRFATKFSLWKNEAF